MPSPRGGPLLPILMATGVLAYVGLHFVEPSLAITWSFGHLHRQPILPMLGAGAVVLIPLLVMWASRSPAWHVAARPLSLRHASLMVLGLFALLAGLEALLPVFQPGGDQEFFLDSVRGTYPLPRWYLASWSLNRLVTLLTFAIGLRRDEGQTLSVLVTYLNAAIGAVGLTALAGAARALAKTRGETTIITLLAWTTFGTLQLAAGYVDVYPIALALTALYLWTAARAVRGEVAPAWPLVIAAMGPVWYEGLALLAPSALLVAIVVARRPGGARAVAWGIAAAVVAAGIATLPPYGVPFAWRALVIDLAETSAYQYGYSPTSSLVPWEYLVTATHLREVLHTVILVDGMGVLAVLVLVVAFARQVVSEPELLVLVGVVVPYLAFVVVMDAVYGAFVDWDLFSYPTAATSLLGGALLVRLYRRAPSTLPALLGLAHAANGVHLLARFHALEVGWKGHVRESPPHVPLPTGHVPPR